jgi:hypothetical protein
VSRTAAGPRRRRSPRPRRSPPASIYCIVAWPSGRRLCFRLCVPLEGLGGCVPLEDTLASAVLRVSGTSAARVGPASGPRPTSTRSSADLNLGAWAAPFGGQVVGPRRTR